MYEWNLLKNRRRKHFYFELIGEGCKVFDIGAHVGDRITTFIQLNASSIVALEPQERFYIYLCKKFDQIKSVTIIQNGVANFVGNMKLHINTMFPTLTTFANEEWQKGMEDYLPVKNTFDETLDVPVVTLDYLIHLYGVPDFIKIDVEGLEYEVLSGLNQRISILSFEFLSNDLRSLEKCLLHCEKLGYTKFNWSKGESFKMRIENWVNKEELFDQMKSLDKKKLIQGDIYVKT